VVIVLLRAFGPSLNPAGRLVSRGEGVSASLPDMETGVVETSEAIPLGCQQNAGKS
jgi:hypothetical protein